MRRVALVVLACLACGSVAHAQPCDCTVKRDPFDKTVVARYKLILAQMPHDHALSALVSLYRKHRTLAQLDDEYAGVMTVAALVVRARLALVAGNKPRALELFTKAANVDDADPRTWVAIGDLSPTSDARTAYERALLHGPAEPLRKAILRKLIALPGNSALVDNAYARLIALEPKNGRLWLERADALAAARANNDALASYTTAESLLARDAERKLYAISRQGHMREHLGMPDRALDDYNRAIAASPKGYYLRQELVGRIIEIHRARQTLGLLLREYQRTWPERSRGHFEWATLAQLHEATGAPDAAILALQKAVAKAPAELQTQRHLIKLLDAAGRTDDARRQLELAAKSAPRDPQIQFELAQRYWTDDPRKVIAILDKLARALPTNVGVRREIGDMYMKLRRIDLAMKEYEVVAKLEPDEGNILLLGETYFAAGFDAKAVRTWQQLAKKRTPQALAALGNVLFEHELYEDSLEAYTQAINLDDTNPELFRARGAVYESARRWSSALADTEVALQLLGDAPYARGHAARYQLIRIIGARQHDEDDEDDLTSRELEWELAFSRTNLAPGYLLAELYGKKPDLQLLRVLKELRKHAPNDDGVALELIRAYRVLRRYDEAVRVVSEVSKTHPARKPELDSVREKIAEERVRVVDEDEVVEIEMWRRSHGPLVDPEAEIRLARTPMAKDAVYGAPLRGGVRLGVGAGLRGEADRAMTFGAIGTFGTGPVAFTARFDWGQREAEMRSFSSIGGAVGVSGRLLTTQGLVLTLGAAQRIERRLGNMIVPAGFERTGFAADFTLEVVPRHWPAAFGLRLEQGLSERARDSMLSFEMGIELR